MRGSERSRRTPRPLSLWVVIAVGFVAGGAHADSLYEPSRYRSLVSDLRAASPGDNLTVIVIESASANASAGAETMRDVDVGAELAGEVGQIAESGASGSLGARTGFSGDGAINRSGRLVARVSVTVDEVLENGDLVVSGTQELHFNQESQSITDRGQVRPQDIAPDNTIESPRLSNSTIEYKGDGILAGAERQSWITRFFGWLL